MSTRWIVILSLTGIVALWFWGRQPIVFRQVRPGGLAEHCYGLLLYADMSTLYIRDEGAHQNLKIVKLTASRTEFEIYVQLIGISECRERVVEIANTMPNFVESHSSDGLNIWLIFRFKRDAKAAGRQLHNFLLPILECMNPSPHRSYELFYKTKSFFGPPKFSKFEERLVSEQSTERQKLIARLVLDKFEARLRKRIEQQRTKIGI